MRHAYNENEATVGKGYQVSGDSFDPSELTLSSTERYWEYREINEYGSNIPTRPHKYMSDEDTSSNFGNGLENLVHD